jgi:hypothetical protein
MMKNQMTALSKGGQKTVHQGKGSQQQPLSTHNNVSASGSVPKPGQPSPTIGNYAKASPMPGPTPPATTGLGSGTWPGIGQ